MSAKPEDGLACKFFVPDTGSCQPGSRYPGQIGGSGPVNDHFGLGVVLQVTGRIRLVHLSLDQVLHGFGFAFSPGKVINGLAFQKGLDSHGKGIIGNVIHPEELAGCRNAGVCIECDETGPGAVRRAGLIGSHSRSDQDVNSSV